MKKRVFALGMMLALLVSVMQPVAVHAQEPVSAGVFQEELSVWLFGKPGVVSPMWNNVSSASCSISVSGRSVTVGVLVFPNNSSYYTSGTLYLERYNGSSWVVAASANVGMNGRVDQSFSSTVSGGYKYRAKFSGTTSGESVQAYSQEVYVQ